MSDKKPKKKKGIIRTEAILLVFAILVLVGVYVSFFLNMHLKYILEKSLTKVYGAEVNIGQINLDLFKPSIEILNVDFTNHEKPMENLFSIGRLASELNRRDLMFFSIISETAYLEGLAVNSPRKKKGYVSPESQRLISYSTDLKGSKEKAFDQKFEGSIFENLYNFSKNKDYQQELKKIAEDLNLKQLEQQYKTLIDEKKLKVKRIEQVFDKKRYQALIDEAKKLNQTPENSKEWISAISTSQKLITEAKEARTQLKDIKQEVVAELADVKNIQNKLQSDVQTKLQQVQNKFKFPDISAASFSQEFFGNLFQTRFYLIQQWVTQLRQNSQEAVAERIGDRATSVIKKGVEAAKQDDDQPSAPDFEAAYKERLAQSIQSQGEFIHFGQDIRPKLWIKKLVIDSNSKATQDLQSFKGHILNIADNQKTIGRPIEVFLRGDLPGQNIKDINVDIKLNHHLQQMGEEFNIAAWYPISSFKIFNDSSFKLFLEKASVRGVLKGDIKDFKISDLGLFNQFKDADFFFETSKSDMQKILQPIFAKLPEFNVDVLFSGNLFDPDMLINSSLGKEVSQGIKTHFSAELTAAQQQIQSIAEGSVKKIQDQYLKPYLGDIDLLNKETLNADQLIQTELKKLEARFKDEQLDKIKDKAKDALKKLKF